MKDIITLSGDIGSGKSSVTSYLADDISFDVVGTGKIQRSIAEKRGMTTLELNKVSQADRSIDDEIDSYVVNLGKTRHRLIVDSRLAWHFIPGSFKVFLSVDPGIGAERVFAASRSDENNASVAAAFDNNRHRQGLEDERFHKLYGINFREYQNYDLVIDTSFSSPEAIATKIKSCFDRWLINQPYAKLWFNPQRLIPTRPVRHCMGSDCDIIINVISESAYDVTCPVDVFVRSGFVYLWDGHKRVIASTKIGIDLIPARLLSEAVDSDLAARLTAASVANGIDVSLLHDWEAALGFTFKRYPEKVDF